MVSVPAQAELCRSEAAPASDRLSGILMAAEAGSEYFS